MSPRGDIELKRFLTPTKLSKEELETGMGRMNNPGAAAKPEARTIYGLVSMRMIRLFVMLRKSGILAQRRQFGLSETEWRIMTQLGEAAPLSLNGLADAMLQDRGQLSRAVKSMVERGLLTRERKPGGPEIEIDLSGEGTALYARMVDWVYERDRVLVEDIPAEDLAQVWQVLTTMMGRAQAMLDEEQRLGD
jgi:DNA-binding MarR family transcriptional regulator